MSSLEIDTSWTPADCLTMKAHSVEFGTSAGERFIVICMQNGRVIKNDVSITTAEINNYDAIITMKINVE